MDITRKQIFVGGDTTDLTYDFSLGSTAPLKLYSNFIDPNNPPTPTDPTWTQIVDVSKLKEQNELPITSTDTTGRTAVYDGKPYILQNSTNPAVRDDFAGKVAGSTVVNPNKIFRDLATTLMSPSALYTN
jgi:hypothetical protein